MLLIMDFTIIRVKMHFFCIWFFFPLHPKTEEENIREKDTRTRTQRHGKGEEEEEEDRQFYIQDSKTFSNE